MSYMSCSLACDDVLIVSTGRNGRQDAITYPFVELSYLDSDRIRLRMLLQLVEPRLLLDDLAEKERKQFFVVSCLSEVFAEALSSHI